MMRVYVTESGYYDESDSFCGTGVIGVDLQPRFAICYPISRGYNRHRVYYHSSRNVILYKRPDSKDGLRLTVITTSPAL